MRPAMSPTPAVQPVAGDPERRLDELLERFPISEVRQCDDGTLEVTPLRTDDGSLEAHLAEVGLSEQELTDRLTDLNARLSESDPMYLENFP